MMKKQLALTAAIAAALCTLSIAARADEQRPLTRDEVVAQVLAARQSGDLYVIESGGVVSHEVAPPVSREKVVAEFMKARQAPPDALAMENSL